MLNCTNHTAKSLLSITLLFCTFYFYSCHQNEDIPSNNDCKTQPSFLKTIGFNPNQSAFSTSEKTKMGLVLLQLNKNGDTTNGGRKIYQHPSWQMGGWLGPIQLDPKGNCFVAPVPLINLIDNPPSKQNIIYKVDAQTGIMNVFAELPVAKNISNTNPYGILGFAYLCQSNTLFASTVQGSTREKEMGCIYAIEASTGKIIDKIEGIDALGMGITGITSQNKLYFGSARTSDVFSVILSKDGKFSDNPQLAFSLADLGPRGDDKVRRIKFNQTSGNMEIYAIEFNFNLTAPTEKQETKFEFSWNAETQKWENRNGLH
jgi:hypothetical protein